MICALMLFFGERARIRLASLFAVALALTIGYKENLMVQNALPINSPTLT